MEPLPETRQVLDEFSRLGIEELRTTLTDMGRRAREICPDCVGLSLGLKDEGLTLTLVASSEDVAGLDAVQYLDDGPCVTSQEIGVTVEVTIQDLLDEGSWAEYARASAAAGVASSLSLPIERLGTLVGGVNLYGSTPDTFDGRHQALAEALGATAEKAITNADLAFSTRLAAAQAPDDFAARADLDIATGIIAETRHIRVDEAHELLRRAAARAGISPARAARVIKAIYGR